MRFLQKRVKPEECKRKSNIKRYKDKLVTCYDTNYFPEEEQTLDILSADGASWGTWHSVEDETFRFTKGSEFYKGHFGSYNSSGYIQDFYPYD